MMMPSHAAPRVVPIEELDELVDNELARSDTSSADWREVYQGHAVRLTRLATVLVGPDEASDLVVETVQRVFANRSAGGTPGWQRHVTVGLDAGELVENSTVDLGVGTLVAIGLPDKATSGAYEIRSGTDTNSAMTSGDLTYPVI